MICCFLFNKLAKIRKSDGASRLIDLSSCITQFPCGQIRTNFIEYLFQNTKVGLVSQTAENCNNSRVMLTTLVLLVMTFLYFVALNRAVLYGYQWSHFKILTDPWYEALFQCVHILQHIRDVVLQFAVLCYNRQKILCSVSNNCRRCSVRISTNSSCSVRIESTTAE